MRGSEIEIRKLVEKGFLPLHIASRDDKYEALVVKLLDAKADKNAKDPEGNAPLHIACDRNQKEIIKLLIKAGADINAKNSEGLTPIALALNKAQGYNHYPQEFIRIIK